jgi:hypothetical protein
MTPLIWLTLALSGPGAAAEPPSDGYMESQSHSQEFPSRGVKVFDAVVVRPVMLVVTAVSSVVFVASLPFTATGVAGGDVGTARENLVSYPFDYTFTRPLGDFSEREERLRPSRYAPP